MLIINIPVPIKFIESRKKLQKRKNRKKTRPKQTSMIVICVPKPTNIWGVWDHIKNVWKWDKRWEPEKIWKNLKIIENLKFKIAQVDLRDMVNKFFFISMLKTHCLLLKIVMLFWTTTTSSSPYPVKLEFIELVPS